MIFRVIISCDSGPFTKLRETTWVDPTSGDPLGVTPWDPRWLSLKFYKDPSYVQLMVMSLML